MNSLRIELKWGVIFALMTLVWMVLERLVGLHDTNIAEHANYTNLIAIPAILVYVFALNDKQRNFYYGKMTFRQGLVTGLLISCVVAVLSPLTQLITSTIITPEYFANVINFVVKEGKMTQKEAEEYFNLKNYIIQGLIGALIMGLMTSIVVSGGFAIFKKIRN